jgi:PPK2 family polyphosphate:nucleotide phosphotransferase
VIEHHQDVKRLRVAPGTAVRIERCDADDLHRRAVKRYGRHDADGLKARAEQALADSRDRLIKAQQLLYADDRYAVLIVLQAMDAAGKDGTIRHVMSGLNPQGCQVFSFKKPSEEELDHTFLWRCMKALPERGRIGIFNRSYYEEVLVVRVHPQLLRAQRLPGDTSGKDFWRRRYEDINSFEHHLVRNGTVILKFFLNMSKVEQKRRFLDRLDDPKKQWKFSAADLEERTYWKDYMQAYSHALSATSTKWAPWYIIPADHKWLARAAVAEIIARRIRTLGLRYPEPSDDMRRALARARRNLERR